MAATRHFQARWIEGKTIKRVRLVQYEPNDNRNTAQAVEAIEFTDGSQVRFLADETEDMPAVVIVYDPANR